MATPTLDRAAIMRAVRTWPTDEQRALAREILGHVDGSFVEEPLGPPDSRGLAGLFAGGRTPPTDDEVTRWLDERKVEKYGFRHAALPAIEPAAIVNHLPPDHGSTGRGTK